MFVSMTQFLDQNFVVKNTGKYRKGVFAKTNIKSGEKIHLFRGETISVKDFVERINSNKENIDDPLQVGKRTYLDLDTISRTFNHSCNPNAALRKRSELFAIKDISKGTEITYDYSLTVAPTEWGMKCKCGSKHCRGTLGDVLSIPKKRLNIYRKIGALQDYMKRLLGEIERVGHYEMPKYELFLLDKVKNTSNL